MAGFVGYEEGEVIFRLFLRAEQVRVTVPGRGQHGGQRDPELDRRDGANNTLAGTISIVRTGFNPQSDFSSILAQSAEPVRTPAARTGILSGMHFDVQIETAPDIRSRARWRRTSRWRRT